jgi:predicted nucleotide-binding protein
MSLSRDNDKRRLGAIRNRRVFVVHGRDETALAQLESVLHKFDMTPVVLKRELISDNYNSPPRQLGIPTEPG